MKTQRTKIHLLGVVLVADASLVPVSEFTQQDGRKKRTAKRLCVTNVTRLLHYFTKRAV